MEKISVRVGGPFAGRHGCSLCKSDAGSDVVRLNIAHFLVERFTVFGIPFQYWMVVAAVGVLLSLFYFSRENSG
jgi:hypothetical protein